MSSLNLQLLSTPISFNRDAAFNTQATSLVTGKRFSASTVRGDKILTISMNGPEPAGNPATGGEEVVRISTVGRPFKIGHDAGGKKTFISFGGEEPPTDPDAAAHSSITESLAISLDGTKGDWHCRIDPATSELIAIFASFGGENRGKPKPSSRSAP